MPRAPPFLLQPSSPQAGQEAQSRPGLAQTWVETGESALESETEHCEGTNIWPATSGVPPGRRLGWWRPVSPASSLQGNFFFPGWIKLAWIFSLSLFGKEQTVRLLPTWDIPGCCRAPGGGRKPSRACWGYRRSQGEPGSRWGSAPSSEHGSERRGEAGGPRRAVFGSTPPAPGRWWPLGPGTARAAPPSLGSSCRGHQPGGGGDSSLPELRPPPAPRV